ncbi:MAG: hypothetical protein ACOYBR_07725 [Fluviibacter sp.]
MLSNTRIYAAILGLTLLSPHSFSQEQIDPVHKLIQQYETMSDKERVSFLQAIALIGIKKSDAPQTSAEPVFAKSPTALPPTAEPPPPAPFVPVSIASPAPNPTPAPIQTQPSAVLAPPIVSPTTTPSPTVAAEPITSIDSNPQPISKAQATVDVASAPTSPILEPQPAVSPPSEKPQTTVQISLPEPTEPHPDAEIQSAVAPAPAILIEMPQPRRPVNLSADASEPAAPIVMAAAQSTPTEFSNVKTEQTTTQPSTNLGHKKSIRVIASQQMDYAFSGTSNPSNSVFGLLLPEYQQKLNNAGAKIDIDDLRNETINFYISSLEDKISDCGYQIVKNDEPISTQAIPLHLETGIQRIVINKTLFETAMIGEASAKLFSEQHVLTSVQTRSSRALTQYVNLLQRSSELKTTLTQTIEALTNQVADKICSVNLN